MGAADVAIQYALAQRGKPYVWGATGPNSFDCSGLMVAAFKAAGVSLPRTTYQQILVGTPVAKTGLQPGDLIFPSIEHVQLYIGNNQVVEAPHAGANVRSVPMWGFMAARRVTAPGTVASPGSSGAAPVSMTPVGLTDGIKQMVNDGLQTVGWFLMAGAGVGLMVTGTLLFLAHTELGSQAVNTATRGATRGLISTPTKSSKTSKTSEGDDQAPARRRDDQAPDEDDSGYQPRHSRGGPGRRRRYQITDESSGDTAYAYGRADLQRRESAARAAGRRIKVERA